MRQQLFKPIVCLLLAFSSPQICFGGSDVTFNIIHCVPAWGQLGSIHFEIDTTYRKGPFSVRFEHPDGKIDSIADLQGFSHTYTNLTPGRYLIKIRCCTSCTATDYLDVLAYDHVLAGGISVIYAMGKGVPLEDSCAILLACTDIEKEEGVVCGMAFSVYNGDNLSAAMIQQMIEKAIVRIGKFKYETQLDEVLPDAFIAEENKILLRFDEKGNVLWAYAEWPLD